MDNEMFEHKKSLELILARIVTNKNEYDKLLETLHYSENIFPIKAILSRLDEIDTLTLTDREKYILNDLTAIYI